MAFIRNNSVVISFADFQDVYDSDQRLFDANEGLTEDLVEEHLIRATERILVKIRNTKWWAEYYASRTPGVTSQTQVASVNPNRILSRQNDFTDLCVFTALGEMILPSIADFSNEENAEYKKMGYYVGRAEKLFAELVTEGDWYDFDGDGVVESGEKQSGVVNPKRIR